MPSHASDAIATPANLEAARTIQQSGVRAARSIEAALSRLIREVEAAEKGEPPIIDGQPAIVHGEPVDLVDWLQSRFLGLAKDELAPVLQDLVSEAEGDALQDLARYVREYRADQARLRGDR